jgi:hypothetical protein
VLSAIRANKTEEGENMETVLIEKAKGNHVDFNAWKWLLKARSTDETRPVLNLVAVSAKRAITCDGSRANFLNIKIAYPKPIKPGLYKVLADTAKQIVLQEQTPEESGTYPDIKSVVPRHMKHAVELPHDDWNARKGEPASIIATRVIRALPEDKTINLNYLKDCVTDGFWKMYPNKIASGPMYFKNCTRSALIMPVRIK